MKHWFPISYAPLLGPDRPALASSESKCDFSPELLRLDPLIGKAGGRRAALCACVVLHVSIQRLCGGAAAINAQIRLSLG